MIDVAFLKNFVKKLSLKPGAYVSFIFSALAFAFLSSATWAYEWIAELYPLGENFIPTLIVICGITMVIALLQLLFDTFKDHDNENGFFRVFNVVCVISEILSLGLFVYAFSLVFSLDHGFSLVNFRNGFEAFADKLPVILISALLLIVVFFASGDRKALKIISVVVIAVSMFCVPSFLTTKYMKTFEVEESMPEIKFKSENLIEGSTITYETLKKGEKADAENILKDDLSCWTPQDTDRKPSDGQPDANSCYIEIQLPETRTFNTAVIRETGNEVQYFRILAETDGEWKSIYESEKIQAFRVCSFDSVTTDKIRLSVDKFRNKDDEAKIRSVGLYNEPKRDVSDFEVTAYQRLDCDVPTEILAKGEEFVNNYARFYDVYSTVLVFDEVYWQADGTLGFINGEEKFATEINALKEIIEHRSNKDHDVKIIVTTLANGLWEETGDDVNSFMMKHWESVADQTIEFVKKYDLAGVDIDWEYPYSTEEWECFDNFIVKLDDGLKAINPDAILSGALSAGKLNMKKETLDRFNQIQFMAYDGHDEDGYQSSLHQAETGLKDFVDNGADISKVNIGIAAYGRPTNTTPFWPSWRDVDDATYWRSKYYDIHYAGQVFDGTFCSPSVAADKTAYALMSGAGGVMVFRVACDKTMDDPNSVARGIQDALNRYATEW